MGPRKERAQWRRPSASGRTASSSPGTRRSVHVLSHGLHYGTGGLRGHSLLRHRERARRSSATATTSSASRSRPSSTTWTLPYSLEEIGEATQELIRRNGFASCYIRPLAFRGYGEMGLYAKTAPDRRDRRRLALGRLPRRGGQAARHPRQGLVLAADLARRPDPARQGLGPVPELDPRQDRVAPTPATTRRSCSTSAASSARARARTSSWSATAQIVTPPHVASILDGISRKSVIQIAARPRLPGDRARHRPRRALHGRRGLPDRHRGRAGAGARDRRPRDLASRARSRG